jgi:hypothetical protein
LFLHHGSRPPALSPLTSLPPSPPQFTSITIS